jgi:hypothetical protein
LLIGNIQPERADESKDGGLLRRGVLDRRYRRELRKVEVVDGPAFCPQPQLRRRHGDLLPPDGSHRGKHGKSVEIDDGTRAVGQELTLLVGVLSPTVGPLRRRAGH